MAPYPVFMNRIRPFEKFGSDLFYFFFLTGPAKSIQIRTLSLKVPESKKEKHRVGAVFDHDDAHFSPNVAPETSAATDR